MSVLFLFSAGTATAQQILTATEFFNAVAANYASVEDYTATMAWLDERGSMSGALAYARPNRIRIDFTDPAEQILVSNGTMLQVFIPQFNVQLRQTLRGDADAPGGLVTAEGLALMRRNYNIAYLEGPEPVPLDPGSATFVTQLRLDRKQVTEGFRQLVLSIDDGGFIRRIVGTKVDWEQVRMDLSDIRINQRISDSFFEQESDPAASATDDFLFSPGG